MRHPSRSYRFAEKSWHCNRLNKVLKGYITEVCRCGRHSCCTAAEKTICFVKHPMKIEQQVIIEK